MVLLARMGLYLLHLKESNLRANGTNYDFVSELISLPISWKLSHSIHNVTEFCSLIPTQNGP